MLFPPKGSQLLRSAKLLFNMMQALLLPLTHKHLSDSKVLQPSLLSVTRE